MCDREGIIRRIKEVLVRTLELEVAPEEIPDDEMLFGEGEHMGIDSIATLEVIVALEEEFGIEVEDDDLDAELFASVALMVDYVEDRVKECRERRLVMLA